MIDIKYISNLSNIKLTKKEEKLYQIQLEKVLDFVSQLNEVKTDNKIKISKGNIIDLSSVNDNVRPSLDTKDAMKNAVSQHNDYFKVGLILKKNNS